ncbi:MAG: hypothetical protein Crog4KO_21120 [Crocinitomicaceae bacterium]
MKVYLLLLLLLPIGASFSQNTSVTITPHTVKYHPNGFIKVKMYTLETGLNVSVRYSNSVENQIISGHRGNGVMKFEDNCLISIESELIRETLDSHDAIPRKNRGQCIAKGNFRDFELYNGFIYYYDDEGERTLTEKVTNGVIQYNPRVSITSERLKYKALLHDLNFNGRTEQRELNQVKSMVFGLDSAGIAAFPFNELYKFRNLTTLDINNKRYTIKDYNTKAALKKAIQNDEGKEIRYHDPHNPYSQDRVVNPPPLPLPLPRIKTVPDSNEIINFPHVEAEFPGGVEALMKYMNDNLVYPEVSKQMQEQGKVYLSFVIEKDGSITNIKVERSISKNLDREAKRLIRNMPNWKPAQMDGQVVCRSRMRLPVVFRLE